MIGIIDMDVLVYRALAKSEKDGTPVIEVFDKLLEDIETNAACDKYSYHLSGIGNFRKNIKQGFTKYKGKRSQKPEQYQFLRNYVLKQYNTITVNLLEADDTAAIEATDLRNKKELYTLITVDKDWQQVGGIWYNISYGSVKAISTEEGLKFFHKQLLTGDTVDNIPGLKGVGPKKADKALEGKDLNQQINKVVKMYKEVYKDDYLDVLNPMGQMLWLKRSYDEPEWTVDFHKDFLKKVLNEKE